MNALNLLNAAKIAQFNKIMVLTVLVFAAIC